MNEYFSDLFKNPENEKILEKALGDSKKSINFNNPPTNSIKFFICRRCILSEEFIDKYLEDGMDKIIMSYQKLNSEYIIKNLKNEKFKISEGLLTNMLSYQRIDEKYIPWIVKLYNSVSNNSVWNIIAYGQKLSTEFIKQHINDFSNCKSTLISFQPNIDFNFLNDIFNFKNIKLLPIELIKNIISSVNLPQSFIRDNFEYLKFIDSYSLLYFQPRIPEDLLLDLKDLLGEKVYDIRIFKNRSSTSGNYSFIYTIIDKRDDKFIMYPISLNDLRIYEYDNDSIYVYKTIVDVRKIPRIKVFDKKYCESLIRVEDKANSEKRFNLSI